MIDLQQILDSLVHAFHAHTPIALGILAFLGILLIWKPKAILKVIAILAALGILIYIMSLIFDTLNIGYSEKEHLIHKTP